MSDIEAQHVIPSSTGWSVRKAGASRATRRYPTRQEAIEAATKIARRRRTEIYVFGRDGRIQERTFFGDEPRTPST